MSAFATLLLSAASYYALFRYQLGAPILAEYEVRDWVYWKRSLAAIPSGPRILIVGDSSSLFGVDSTSIESAFGRPVVNLSTHAGFPLDWMTRFALEISQPGDTVVMPLAWIAYGRDYRRPESWMTDQIVGWDREFFDESDPLEKLRYLSAISPSDFLRNIRAKLHQGATFKEYPWRIPASANDIVRKIRAQNGKVDQGQPYSALNLTDHGDMGGACGTNGIVQHSFPLNPYFPMNEHQLELLSETAKKLHARGIAMIVMPSVVLEDAQSMEPKYRNYLSSIYPTLRAAGVTTAGDPLDFYFPPSAFFNTGFHLNCEHREERSQRMIKALRLFISPRIKEQGQDVARQISGAAAASERPDVKSGT